MIENVTFRVLKGTSSPMVLIEVTQLEKTCRLLPSYLFYDIELTISAYKYNNHVYVGVYIHIHRCIMVDIESTSNNSHFI